MTKKQLLKILCDAPDDDTPIILCLVQKGICIEAVEVTDAYQDKGSNRFFLEGETKRMLLD